MSSGLLISTTNPPRDQGRQPSSMSVTSTIKILLLTIAVLLGVIIGILTGLLAHLRGAHLAAAIRDGGVGFAGTTTLTVLLLSSLDAL